MSEGVIGGGIFRASACASWGRLLDGPATPEAAACGWARPFSSVSPSLSAPVDIGGTSPEDMAGGEDDGHDVPLNEDGYDPEAAVEDIHRASQKNQGMGPGGEWDPAFVRRALATYERHLRYVLRMLEAAREEDGGGDGNGGDFDGIAAQVHPDTGKHRATRTLLSSDTVACAFRSVTRSNVDTYIMGRRVRDLERLVGSIGLTPLTDRLSQNLLEANGKAGNVGRSLSLIGLRGSRGYPPTRYEFRHAIQSIQSAGLYLRRGRNVFLGEKGQPPLDNPTRWLDAILLNMSGRGVQLDVGTANKMLDCYASMGRTGKAVHFFYDVVRDFVEGDGTYYDSREAKAAGGGRTEHGGGLEGRKIPRKVRAGMPTFYDRKVKVRMRMKNPPPFHKVPSKVKGGLLAKSGESDSKVAKLERETERSWSPALAAAFAFADSLTHGACGHDPIDLNQESWNILVSACCKRGALWRAMQIADETMPARGFKPDVYTFNTILAALAMVGDAPTMREMMTKMTNVGLTPHKLAVDSIVSGLLNAGDVVGAVTVVQDMFNQHSTLPSYTTHLMIIEFALANDLVYEAKRYVYFLQQLWKWRPTESHSPELRKLIHLTKANPKLKKKALKKLFRYFGEELTEEDFF